MGLDLRPATPDDVPCIHSITQEAYREYLGVLEPPSGAHSESESDVRQALMDGGAVLATLDGSPAGSVRFQPEEGSFYVGRLAVLPGRRRSGIGSALLNFVEAEARKAGAQRLRLRVRLSLADNVRLHAHLAGTGSSASIREATRRSRSRC